MTVTSKRYHSNIDDAGVSYGSSLGTGNKRNIISGLDGGIRGGAWDSIPSPGLVLF